MQAGGLVRRLEDAQRIDVLARMTRPGSKLAPPRRSVRALEPVSTKANRAAGAVRERPNGVQGRWDVLRLVDDDERAGRQRIDFATKRILGVAEERRLVGRSTQWAGPRLRQTVDLPTCLGPIVSAADLIEAAKKLDAARSR